MEALCATLAGIVGASHVLTDAADTASYLTDWRGRYSGAARCVVRPGSTREVAAVVAACASEGVPMVPQGGNTGLCGGATPDALGNTVLLSLSRLNRIRHIDLENNTLTVESGCTLASVQEAACRHARLFPLSLAAEGSCQIGGNLSTNAGGVQVLRYGNTRDLTLGLEVVLPDGQVWDGLRELRKDNTGYDLKHLFIGAEGTLGIITAAVLKLFPQPAATATAWLGVDSPAAAVALLSMAQARFGAQLTAFELIGEPALCMVCKHIPGAVPPLAKFPWYVLMDISAMEERGELDEPLAAFLAAACERGAVRDAVLAQTLEQAKRLWSLRENISEAQRIEGVSIKHDVSLPLSRLAAFVSRADAALAKVYPGVRIVCFGHVGDGNLHYNLSRPEIGQNEEFIARTDEVNRLVHDLVAELGGSISAEHGLGQLKREEILRYKSPLELALMRRLKDALDPQGLMNPGKIFV